MPAINKDPTRTRFSRIYRRSLMFFLIGLFFLISPAIILYTAGIRFNFSLFAFEPTGALSIDIKPHDSELRVNDIIIPDGLPARISGLASGIYRVRANKNGFHTFTKDLSVIPGETTYVRDIRLFQKTEPVKIREIDGDIGNVFILSDNPLRYAYLSGTTSTESLIIIGTDYKKIPIPTGSETTCDREGGKCENVEKTGRTKIIDWISGTVMESEASAKNSNEIKKTIALEKNFSLIRNGDSITVIKNTDTVGGESKKIPALGWHYHEPTEQWRIASEWEITTVYSDGNTAIIYRSDKPIKSIRSLYESDSILVATEQSIVAVNPGYSVSQELTNFDSITAIDSSIATNIIMIAGVWRGERGLFMLRY